MLHLQSHIVQPLFINTNNRMYFMSHLPGKYQHMVKIQKINKQYVNVITEWNHFYARLKSHVASSPESIALKKEDGYKLAFFFNFTAHFFSYFSTEKNSKDYALDQEYIQGVREFFNQQGVLFCLFPQDLFHEKNQNVLLVNAFN